MAEDDYTAATIELYSQVISKPKMTDKLLKKPPFRFLHDVFTATSKATGYGKGLFSGHMLNSKEVTEKDDKLRLKENLHETLQPIQLTVCFTFNFNFHF